MKYLIKIASELGILRKLIAIFILAEGNLSKNAP